MIDLIPGFLFFRQNSAKLKIYAASWLFSYLCYTNNSQERAKKNKPMDRKSKIFFFIFLLAVLVVTVMAFYKFYILRDYYITSEAACDPETENCFIYKCDPADDSACPEEPAERISYYKLIEKKANTLPLCDPNNPDCPPIACRAGEDCRETLCDEATKTEDEQCSDPAEYLKNK